MTREVTLNRIKRKEAKKMATTPTIEDLANQLTAIQQQLTAMATLPTAVKTLEATVAQLQAPKSAAQIRVGQLAAQAAIIQQQFAQHQLAYERLHTLQSMAPGLIGTQKALEELMIHRIEKLLAEPQKATAEDINQVTDMIGRLQGELALANQTYGGQLMMQQPLGQYAQPAPPAANIGGYPVSPELLGSTMMAGVVGGVVGGLGALAASLTLPYVAGVALLAAAVAALLWWCGNYKPAPAALAPAAAAPPLPPAPLSPQANGI